MSRAKGIRKSALKENKKMSRNNYWSNLGSVVREKQIGIINNF